MRTVLMILLLASLGWAEDAFGTWKMNPARSTFTGDPHPTAVTVRIEQHAKGEVFTFDRFRADGHAVTLSMILYLDGKERGFQGDACFGTQSSRRLGGRTIELVLKCRDGRTRLMRRSTTSPNELILDITEERTGGRHFERHLILEKQEEEKP